MKNNIKYIMGSKHGKFDPKICPPKIPFKNRQCSTKIQESKLKSFCIFHFENIYALIGFMVS